MNSNLRPEQIKKVFERALSVEPVPAAQPMIQRAEQPSVSRRWIVPVFAIAASILGVLFVSSVETSSAPVAQKSITLNPVANNSAPMAAPSTTPVELVSSKEALLQRAKEMAASGDFAAAGELATQAGDEAMAERYFNEMNVREFLPLCSEALKAKNAEDIFTYCHDALKTFTQTDAYKKNQATIDEAKRVFKEDSLAGANQSLQRVEASPAPNKLSKAKEEVRKAKEKLEQIIAFCGSDAELEALLTRANALMEQLDPTTKPRCDLSRCINGCEEDGETCKPVSVSLNCDQRCINGCSPDGTCKSDTINTDAVRRKLTQPDGCSVVTKSEWDALKKSSNPDYLYFKGYCTGDVNPEQACNFYLKFIKAAPGDTRAGKAKSYIASQDPSAYPTCVLP